MKKLLSLQTLFLMMAIIFGVYYYVLIQVNVHTLQHTKSNSDSFTFSLHSQINQSVKLHIATGRFKLIKVECNAHEVTFPDAKMQWFEGLGEQTYFYLSKGENHCSVQTANNSREFTPIVKQKITFVDYLILFLALGIPLFHFLFKLFIFLLSKIKNKFSSFIKERAYAKWSSKERTKYDGKTLWWTRLLFIVLFFGVLIRVLYFHKFGITTFQHDWHGHIEFIKYMADTWTLPLASKGLEYPQQPLYYFVAGGIYAFFIGMGFQDGEALFAIGYFSLLLSFVFLYYGYRFITLLTHDLRVQTIAVSFLSLTPSLVYLSARINNDTLVMALSAASLYYVVKSYQKNFRQYYYSALSLVSLLFMTKISAAPIELLLFFLLIWSYLKVEKSDLRLTQRNIYIFGVVGIFLLGFTLLRVYLPVEGTLHMVNSSGNYPNQTIENINMSYLGTFHMIPLIETGYSYVFGNDAIRYSFWTYLYGTMFFGEFDYSSHINNHMAMKFIMQTILLFGLIYILGLLLYIVTMYKSSLLNRLLLLTLFFNLLLVWKFLFSFPAVCNSDFRYFVGSYVLVAYFVARGLYTLHNIKWLSSLISLIVIILVTVKVLFFTMLLL